MDSSYLSNSNETYDLVLLSVEGQIMLVLLYTITAVVSLGANVLAIFILLSRDRLTSELWKYLVNLSAADILMSLFSIPFSYTSFMLGRWIFPIWMCPIVQFAQLCSVFVSVYTLTIIGFDRYFAIIYPFYSLNYLKTHKTQVLIFTWIFGAAFSSVQLVQTQATPFRWGNETYYDCKELWDERQGQYFTIIIFVATFGLPVAALVFVYTSIGIYIINRTAPGNPDIVRDMSQWVLKIKVIKMLVTIVILFILCWLPIHVHSFIVWFAPPNVNVLTSYLIYVISYFVCHWLAMAHSFLNPFIYGFMSENFKISFRKIFYHRSYRDSKTETELEKLSNLTNVHSNSVKEQKK